MRTQPFNLIARTLTKRLLSVLVYTWLRYVGACSVGARITSVFDVCASSTLFVCHYSCLEQNLHWLSETGNLSRHNGDPIRGPLKPLITIVVWYTGDFRWEFNWPPMMPRDRWCFFFPVWLLLINQQFTIWKKMTWT